MCTVLGDTAMARRRSGGSSFDSLGFLSSGPISSPRLPSLHALDQARALVRAIEDRRRFHPLGSLRPVMAVSRGFRRVQVTPDKLAGRFPPTGLSFSVPKGVALCVRRKERREVIFAQRKQGKGSRSKRKRNYWSQVRC